MGVPSKSVPPSLSLQFPSLEVGGGGFIRIFFYAI